MGGTCEINASEIVCRANETDSETEGAEIRQEVGKGRDF